MGLRSSVLQIIDFFVGGGGVVFRSLDFYFISHLMLKLRIKNQIRAGSPGGSSSAGGPSPAPAGESKPATRNASESPLPLPPTLFSGKFFTGKLNNQKQIKVPVKTTSDWPTIGQLKCILSVIGQLYCMTSFFVGSISYYFCCNAILKYLVCPSDINVICSGE